MFCFSAVLYRKVCETFKLCFWVWGVKHIFIKLWSLILFFNDDWPFNITINFWWRLLKLTVHKHLRLVVSVKQHVTITVYKTYSFSSNGWVASARIRDRFEEFFIFRRAPAQPANFWLTAPCNNCAIHAMPAHTKLMSFTHTNNAKCLVKKN